MKQLKLIHKIEIDERELQLYKETLQQNTIESMIAFVEAVKKLNYTWESEELKVIKSQFPFKHKNNFQISLGHS